MNPKRYFSKIPPQNKPTKNMYCATPDFNGSRSENIADNSRSYHAPFVYIRISNGRNCLNRNANYDRKKLVEDGGGFDRWREHFKGNRQRNQCNRRWCNDAEFLHKTKNLVMDCWLYKPLFVLVILSLFVPTMSKRCRYEECTSNYRTAIEQTGLMDVEKESSIYCPIVQSYVKCMRSTERSCRGDLLYHSAFHGFAAVDANCARNGNNRSSTVAPNPRPSGSSSMSPPPSCKYFGTYRFRHCGLYGDPHLKTFEGEYQTCKIYGTWALIDNPYMSVQVTNQYVVPGSSATAPTKISIVIKGGRSTPCTLEKRYEADSESPLPRTFVDATNRSGPDNTVVLTSRPGSTESVEIVMKYIVSRLIVRKIGRYLAFSANLPEDLIKSYNAHRVELCSSGCPANEQLNTYSTMPPPGTKYRMSREEALLKCTAPASVAPDQEADPSSSASFGNELSNNLTDNYLDWCVFDLMTSGDIYDFVAAAHAAQNDAILLDPGSLQNRTTLLSADLPPNFVPPGEPSSGSRLSTLPASVFFATSSLIFLLKLLRPF